MCLRNSPQVSGPASGRATVHRSHAYMRWIWHILYILYSLEVGLFLIFLPWLRIWDNNYLLYLFPEIQPIIGNAFLKGAVLGLGIVNLLIGIQEIVEFKREIKSHFSK